MSSGNGYYQEMMDDFFSSEYDEDSASGAMKVAQQGALIGQMVGNDMAKNLAQFNQSISQENATHVADLEQRNQSALMKDEFNYGMQSMDAQFQYKNQFANAQYDRDLGMVSATGQQDRLNISAQGQQDRLGYIVQGEQQRLADKQNNVSKEKIATGRYQADKYIADSQGEASRDVATTQKEGETYKADRSKEAALGVAATEADASKYGADAAKESSMYGADKTVDVAKVNVQGTIDNTRVTGDETRKTQDNEQRLKAKDRANMHTYAKNQARNI